MKRKLISALVILTLAICAFALVACNDDDAAGAGANGVGIEKVAYNAEGKLVVYYTNGTSSVVEIGTCAHANAEKYELAKANCAEEGKILVICNDCRTSSVETTEIDPDNHDTVRTVVDATCTKAGSWNEKCACGKFNTDGVIAKLGHQYFTDEDITLANAGIGANGSIDNYAKFAAVVLNEKFAGKFVAPTCLTDGYFEFTCVREGCADCDKEEHVLAEGAKDVYSACEACNNFYIIDKEVDKNLDMPGVHGTYSWKNVVEAGKNICVDGGQKIFVCDNCFNNPFFSCMDCKDAIKESRTVAANGHKITNAWINSAMKVPTLTDKGYIEGLCTECGLERASIVLPALSDVAADYNFTNYKAATCTEKGIDIYTYVNNGVRIPFAVETAVAPHTHDRKIMNKSLYYETEVDELLGELDKCGKTCQALYTCDDCGKKQIVTATKAHDETKITVDAKLSYDATCFSEGKKVFSCSDCKGTYEETIPMIAHFLKLETIKENDMIVALKFVCANTGCNKNPANATAVPYSEYYELATPVATVDEIITDKVIAKCDTDGYAMYTFDYLVYILDEENYTVTSAIENNYPKTVKFIAIGHNYKVDANDNGTPFNTAHEYSWTELMKLFNNDATAFEWADDTATCSKAGNIITNCSDCNKSVIIKGMKAHTWEKTGEPVAETCTEDGYTLYTCKVCNAVEKQDIVNEITGHDYVIDTNRSSIDMNGTSTIVFVCQRKDCGDVKIVDNATNIEEHDEKATCGVEGKLWYSFYYVEVAGQAPKYDELVAKVYPKSSKHSYNGAIVDINKAWTTDDLTGIFTANGNVDDLEFINQPENCKATGNAVFVCTAADCGKKVLIQTVIGPHTVEGAGTKVEATCTEGEYLTWTCKNNCENPIVKLYNDQKPALGHKYNLEVVANPTDAATGKLHVTCDREDCGFDKEYVLPKLGEWTLTGEGSGTTCTMGNYKKYTYYDFKIDNLGTEEEPNYVKKDITITITNEAAAEHNYIGKAITYTDGEFEYTARFCNSCKQYVIIDKKEVAADAE